MLHPRDVSHMGLTRAAGLGDDGAEHLWRAAGSDSGAAPRRGASPGEARLLTVGLRVSHRVTSHWSVISLTIFEMRVMSHRDRSIADVPPGVFPQQNCQSIPS